MNNFTKILIVVEFILMISIIGLALIDDKKVTGYAVLGNAGIGKTDFKIFTKAVCDEKGEHTFCKDELFVKCGGKEVVVQKGNLNNFTECGIKINLSDAFANGSAEFGNGWTDPREHD